eukprot:scaffold64510_cov59-Phaeocystis_antarctica.AAC.3
MEVGSLDLEVYSPRSPPWGFTDSDTPEPTTYGTPVLTARPTFRRKLRPETACRAREHVHWVAVVIPGIALGEVRLVH